MAAKFDKPPFWKRKDALAKAGVKSVENDGEGFINVSDEPVEDNGTVYTYETDPGTGEPRLKSNRKFKVKLRERPEKKDGKEFIENRVKLDPYRYKREMGSRIHQTTLDPDGLSAGDITNDWTSSHKGRYIKWTMIGLVTLCLLWIGKELWEAGPGAFFGTILITLLLIGIIREGLIYGEGSIFKMRIWAGFGRWF